jgi:DNA-binding beta-propeller fold protein YncE
MQDAKTRRSTWPARPALTRAAALAGILLSVPALAAEKTILILHKGADSLGFYDAGDGKSRAVVPVGTVPHEMVLSADRSLVYITNYGVGSYTSKDEGGRTVSIVDVARRAKIGEIDLGAYRRPHGIQRGRSGRLYVTVDTPGSLLVIDPGTRTVVAHVDLEQSLPHMVAISEDEKRAWTANAGAGTVTAVRFGPPVGVRQIAVGGVPMGLLLSEDGSRAFVATRNGNEVVAIDTETDLAVDRIRVDGSPARLCFAKDGRKLLVSLLESGEVAVIDLWSRREERRFKVGAHAEGLTLDAGGRFGYVSAQGDDKVVRFSLRDWQSTLTIPTASRPDPIIVLDGR